MTKGNWNGIKNFKPKDFHEDPLKFANINTVKALDAYRDRIGRRIFPSPVKGAVARVTGSKDSQHYVGSWITPKRKSTALDIFCEGYPIMNFTDLVSMKVFTGIGVYLDTTGPDGKSWVMFHVDQRAQMVPPIQHPLIWMCTKKKTDKNKTKNIYTYQYQQDKFVELMKNERLFTNKLYGISTS